jgi:hypothetical protein
MSEEKENEYLRYRRKQERLFVKGDVSFQEFLTRIGSYYRSLAIETDGILKSENIRSTTENIGSQSRST